MLALGTACAEALLKAFERDRMSMASAGDQLQDNVVGEVAWVTFLFDKPKLDDRQRTEALLAVMHKAAGEDFSPPECIDETIGGREALLGWFHW